MAKKKLTKLGAIRGSGDQHQTREPRTLGYERVRMERIKENVSKMKELGLKDQAKSLMALVQNNRGSRSKAKIKKVSKDNELYQPNQDSDMEHELVSCGEELPIPHSKCNLKSKSIPWKIRKMKAVTQKSVKIASAFKKCRQKVHLASSSSSSGGSSTPSHASQHHVIRREPVETLELEVRHLDQNENDKENGGMDKPRRGPTMCYKVHGRSEEERLEITLNEHGQPIGPDDKTCNEFTSFLGTIARKANILPLTVQNWPILRNEKKDELWEYVMKHYIVPIEGKKWVLQTIGSCWRAYKCSLKKNHFKKYDNDKMRMKKRPIRVPKIMFKELLKIWHSDKHKEISERNTANRLVGKEKNVMHTAGPKSFARVQEKWKKERKTTKKPTLAEMFIETRKEKQTKRKPGDPRDKLIRELRDINSPKDGDGVVAAVFNSSDKKKGKLCLQGRDVSSTQLNQKAMMKETEKKHANEVKAIEKYYEDRRQQDRVELANGLRSLFSQLQQQIPHTSFDLGVFGSLFLDDHSEKDANCQDNMEGMLPLQSASTSNQGVNHMTDEQEEEAIEDEDEDLI